MTPPVRIVAISPDEAAVHDLPRNALDTLRGLAGNGTGYRWDAGRGTWVVSATWAAGIAAWCRARDRRVEITSEVGT